MYIIHIYYLIDNIP